MTRKQRTTIAPSPISTSVDFADELQQSRRRALALGLIACSPVALTAFAQTQRSQGWPQRAVKLVVPYAAGGSADTLGRLIAEYLTSSLAQPFIIDNKGGAGGTLGSMVVAKAPPDGYTLVLSGIGSHVIAPLLLGNGMNPMKDFTHIALLGGPPSALVVNSDLPVKDIQGFIAYVNAAPKGLSWGSPGLGTHAQLIGQLFAASNKLNLVHISYKGAGPAVMDLLGGQIQAGFMTLRSASSHIQSGKLRALAITSAKRVEDHPDVPTFAELGYPKLTAITWFSVSGPAGLPNAIVTALNAEIRKGLHSPTIKKQLMLEGIETQDLDPERFNQFFQSEISRWAPLIKSVKSPVS
jgi:tripartite-type tricarboxylate transporter receptor subunit TctC